MLTSQKDFASQNKSLWSDTHLKTFWQKCPKRTQERGNRTQILVEIVQSKVLSWTIVGERERVNLIIQQTLYIYTLEVAKDSLVENWCQQCLGRFRVIHSLHLLLRVAQLGLLLLVIFCFCSLRNLQSDPKKIRFNGHYFSRPTKREPRSHLRVHVLRATSTSSDPITSTCTYLLVNLKHINKYKSFMYKIYIN